MEKNYDRRRFLRLLAKEAHESLAHLTCRATPFQNSAELHDAIFQELGIDDRELRVAAIEFEHALKHALAAIEAYCVAIDNALRLCLEIKDKNKDQGDTHTCDGSVCEGANDRIKDWLALNRTLTYKKKDAAIKPAMSALIQARDDQARLWKEYCVAEESFCKALLQCAEGVLTRHPVQTATAFVARTTLDPTRLASIALDRLAAWLWDCDRDECDSDRDTFNLLEAECVVLIEHIAAACRTQDTAIHCSDAACPRRKATQLGARQCLRALLLAPSARCMHVTP